MQNMHILNSRETKHILEKLESQYGWDVNKGDLDFIFLMNKDNRLYVVSRNLGDINTELLKIDSIGIYFGELYKETIRLSIEGAQIIGSATTKNIVEIDHDSMIEWVKGGDIMFEDCGRDFVIVKHIDEKTGKGDILGCGKYKGGKLINYVSKSRRLVVVNE